MGVKNPCHKIMAGAFHNNIFKYSHVSQHSRTHFREIDRKCFTTVPIRRRTIFLGKYRGFLKFITRSYHHSRSPSNRFLQVRPVAFIFK